ncbi:MAG: beta-ketoacyl-ACP synthase II, partial [Bacteroidota bacterium]
MDLKRVVVTGLGAVTPIGNNVEDYWNALIAGTSGAGPITRFDATNFKTQFACEVKGLDMNEYFGRKEARKIDPFAQFGIVASDQAVEDANFDLEAINMDRVGVIWGSGIGGLKTLETEIMGFLQGNGTPRYSPFLVPRMIIDIVTGHISIKYGFRGINYAVVSACATSTHAIGNAFDAIRLGRADVMVTGGSEAAVLETSIGGFNAMRALSTRNDDAKTASRPFDKDRDGFVMGEGGAALILESLEHAKARGAKIYAEVAGTGATADAYHITAPHPEGIGAMNVMKLAIQDAGMTVEDIDYVNVHGTSTPLGDVAELKGIGKVFGAHAYELNISSTKSMTGHLLGAAGAVEAIASIKAVQTDEVP